MPDVFQWALFMFGQPPLAELHLQQECGESNQQADCISAIRGKIEAYREIDDCSYYGLGDIVGEAHLAIKTQAVDGVSEFLALIKKYEGRYQDQSKGQFLPHIEYSPYRLLYDCTVLHDKLLQRI